MHTHTNHSEELANMNLFFQPHQSGVRKVEAAKTTMREEEGVREGGRREGEERKEERREGRREERGCCCKCRKSQFFILLALSHTHFIDASDIHVFTRCI